MEFKVIRRDLKDVIEGLKINDTGYIRGIHLEYLGHKLYDVFIHGKGLYFLYDYQIEIG